MAKKTKRVRTKRRELQRAATKEVRAREKLNLAALGGNQGRAIEVSTPAVISSKVRSMRCHQCAGELEHAEQSARSTDAGLRRVVETRCRRCHAPRTIWFAIGPTLN